MIIRKSLLAIAAAGMALGSTAATAAPVATDRSGSEIGASENMRGMGGIGLGMSIVQKIVEAHGGRIHARSVPGKETSICFSLPLAMAVPGKPLNDQVRARR